MSASTLYSRRQHLRITGGHCGRGADQRATGAYDVPDACANLLLLVAEVLDLDLHRIERARGFATRLHGTQQDILDKKTARGTAAGSRQQAACSSSHRRHGRAHRLPSAVIPVDRHPLAPALRAPTSPAAPADPAALYYRLKQALPCTPRWRWRADRRWTQQFTLHSVQSRGYSCLS